MGISEDSEFGREPIQAHVSILPIKPLRHLRPSDEGQEEKYHDGNSEI